MPEKRPEHHWNEAANQYMMREFYPTEGKANLGNDLNQIKTKDYYATAPLPGEYHESLGAVKSYGSLKRKDLNKVVRAAAITTGVALISAATLMTYITGGRPELIKYDYYAYHDYAYVFGLVQTHKATSFVCELRYPSGYREKQYFEVPGAYEEYEIYFSFEIFGGEGVYTITLDYNVGYGEVLLKRDRFVPEPLV